MLRDIRNRIRQRGTAGVETALALPLLLGVGFLGADVYRIGIERTRLEGTSSTIAINISAQSALTRAGLDGLVDISMQGSADEQQMIILNVLQSGTIVWQLTRGEAMDLCEAPSDGATYTGELPEAADEEDDDGEDVLENNSSSLVVVRACRDMRPRAFYSGMVGPEILQVDSIYRVNGRTIELDEELQEENSVESSGE